jgi:choline dehydrogenase
LQIHFSPIIYSHEGLVEPTEHGFTLGPVLLYPKSKGSVTLRSNNHSVAPIIQPNYLAEVKESLFSNPECS